MEQTTFEKLKQIIIDQLGVADVSVTESAEFLTDLRADSLDVVELAMAVEDDFGINILDEDVEKCKTVKDAVELIDRLTK